MATANSSRLLGAFSQWAAIAACALLGFAVFSFVDMTPEVEADFFFSRDDPQSRGAQASEYSQQVVVAARSAHVVSRGYIRRVHELTQDLLRIRGVSDVRSITRGPEETEKILEKDPPDAFEDLRERPFWSRLLLAPDGSATFLVLQVQERQAEAAVSSIDAVLRRHSARGFELRGSGVPYVTEHIRRKLAEELRAFSIAAFLAFGVLVTVLFRSLAVLLGTMVAALSACFATFLIRAVFGMRTDLLAPNLWTIAFVLTLSHVVYLTAQWRRQLPQVGQDAVWESIRLTGPASVASLMANVLGFASLMFVSAQPLRQLGISGVIAAVAAILSSYLLFPPFLRAARTGTAAAPSSGRLHRFFTTPHRAVAVLVVVAGLALAPFAWRVNTDPSLPSYFSRDDPIRTGLQAIDRATGSSPLEMVVADAGGLPLDDDDRLDRLTALEHRLERHPDVGSVLSIASLMGEADRPWYSFLFSWDKKLEKLESPEHGRVGKIFISQDRLRGRFLLRMKEQARARPRAAVVRDLTGIVRHYGFRPVQIGGLYPLQGEMSRLVEGSVVRGLGSLLGAFFVIVLLVTRSLVSSLVMTLCLALTPFLLFGVVGLARMPLDIISAPAANVALPLGIDEMIHLGDRVRRLRRAATDTATAWRQALGQLWAPILASMLVVTSGFALFLLSDFPPTRRLGILVCVGAAITDLVVLVVLPALATMLSRRKGAEQRRKAA